MFRPGGTELIEWNLDYQHSSPGEGQNKCSLLLHALAGTNVVEEPGFHSCLLPDLLPAAQTVWVSSLLAHPGHLAGWSLVPPGSVILPGQYVATVAAHQLPKLSELIQREVVTIWMGQPV